MSAVQSRPDVVGGAQRRAPMGGDAKGIPWNWRT